MKKLKLIIFATCLMAWCITFMSQAQQICGTDEIHQRRLQTDPAYSSRYNLMNNNAQSLVMQNQNQKFQSSLMPVINIPVVVHVVHIGEAIGTGSNVSDASINAMIADLNNRFANANGNGVNMNVQFCLAVRDPNNNATTGITRHNGSSIPGYSANGVGYVQPSPCGGANDTLIKNLSDWSCASYYNIWIVKQICDAGGYATLPWAVVKWDGIIIGAGSMTNGQLFAHETGHWLNLLHTFQGQSGTTCPPNANCATDGDQVCDTPPVKQGECTTSVCSGGNIVNSTANYLSYCFGSWDRFTQGQKDRVAACLNTNPRNLLLNSMGCVPVTPNDAGISLITNPTSTTYTTLCVGANYSTAPAVTLKNSGTSALTSVIIKYRLDNNALSTYSWSGNLASYASVNVTLPSISIPQGSHTFQAYTTLPNGAADGFNANDSSSVAGINITGPTPISATTTQTNTTCAGNNGTATVTAVGGSGLVVTNNTDFEGTNTWTLVNGSQLNKWFVGTATAAGGTKSIYVSDDNGVSNHYSQSPSFDVSHFYKNFVFPANATNIKVQFQWKSEGEVYNGTTFYDFLKVFLAPLNVFPSAGIPFSAIAISPGLYGNPSSYITQVITGLDSIAGSSRNLVFSWESDFYAQNQPPASVDNIIVSYNIPVTYTYLWSNGQTTATTTGLAPGVYTCTITDGNGCTGTKSVTILNGCAGVSISAGGPTTFCQGGNVLLTSSLPTGNLWSNGATTQSITVTTSGNYSCTNGANTSNTIVVTVNSIPATPTISNSGATTFCQGGSVTLTSSSASGNLWSTGATTQSISASTSGNYVVTVTSSGCTSSPSIAKVVTVNPIPATPTISASGPTTFCTGGSVTLTSSAATGNLWSTGATTQSISATTSGNYIVTVTANGCTSSPSIAKVVTVNPIPETPTISAGGPTTFCTGGNVTLTSSAATGNLWSTGATTQSISATTSGNYTVAVTSSGCTSSPSSATTVTVQACSISISAGGPTTFCQGGSVVLTSSLPSGNVWSTGATTQSITVSTSGSYSCINSGNTSNTIVVTVNPIPTTPAIINGGPTTFCQGGSVTLSSSSSSGNLWSTGATTQSINVTTSGNYAVTITQNGCTSSPSNTIVVTVNPIPSTPTISAGGPTTFCTGGSVTLTSSATTGNLWSTGATTQSINVTTSGNYTVAVTSNGCTSSPSAATTVTVQTCGSLTITAGGPTTFCSGGNVVLTSSLPTGNLWSNGATTQSITVTASGNYNCTNGGSTSNTINVTVNPAPNTSTSHTGTVTLCTGGLINGPTPGNAISLNGYYDYIDAGNSAALQITGNITLEAWINADYYTANSWQGSIINKEDYTSQSYGYMLRCGNNGQLSFNLGSETGSWSEIQSNVGAMTIGTWYHVAGTYDGATMKLFINGNLVASAPKSGLLGLATTNLFIGSSQLDASRTFEGKIDEVRIWNIARTQSQLQSNMNKTVSTSSSGLAALYRLDETTGTSVLESVSGTNSATAYNPSIWMVPSSVPWNVAGYLWSNGATTKGTNISSLGTYTLTVTAFSGCTASAAPIVVSNLKPAADATITASGPTTFCQGGSVVLSAPTKGNSLQFDGADDVVTMATPMIPTSGAYSVLFWAKETTSQSGFRNILSQGRNFYIGRDNNGIIRVGDGWTNTGVAWPTDLQWHHYAVVRSATNVFLYLDGNLVATKGSAIGSPVSVSGESNLFRIGDQFCNPCSENFKGQVDDITIWNNLRNDVQIRSAMNSSVSTASSGLVAYYKLDEGAGTSTFNAVNNANPGVLTGGPSWVGSSSVPYTVSSYQWSTGATTQNITATTKTTYKVTVTNMAGCTTSASKKVIISTPSGAVSVTGSLILCSGSTVTLTSNTGAGNTYQWTVNGNNIPGATNQSYVASTAGTYRVIITNSIGCTKISGSKTVAECSRLGDVVAETAYNLSVYPNPAVESVSVSFDCENTSADFQIVNEIGAIVLMKNLKSEDGIYDENVNVAGLAPGIYMIVVRTNNGIATNRFIKQ